MLLSNAHGGRLPGSAPINEALTPLEFTVGAGNIFYVRFTSYGNSRVVGHFHASGGEGNDIQVVIANADNFENWKNGHTARVLYQSPVTTTDMLNVPISASGTYYLAFSNKFSVFNSKNVSSDIQLQR
jgi:hypothetical protein